MLKNNLGEEIVVTKIEGGKIYFERGKGKKKQLTNFKWIDGPLFEPIFMKTFFVLGLKIDLNIWKKIKTLKV